MNREDIIRMGRQAGAFIELAQEKDLLWLERFAALVAKHTLANIDPSSFMSWQEGYEAGAFAERRECEKIIWNADTWIGSDAKIWLVKSIQEERGQA